MFFWTTRYLPRAHGRYLRNLVLMRSANVQKTLEKHSAIYLVINVLTSLLKTRIYNVFSSSVSSIFSKFCYNRKNTKQTLLQTGADLIYTIFGVRIPKVCVPWGAWWYFWAKFKKFKTVLRFCPYWTCCIIQTRCWVRNQNYIMNYHEIFIANIE